CRFISHVVVPIPGPCSGDAYWYRNNTNLATRNPKCYRVNGIDSIPIGDLSMKTSLLAAAALLALGQSAFAHDIESAVDPSKPAAFDITSASATTDGRLSTFMMEVAGEAGSVKPEAAGQLQGSKVAAYVWPTGFDPSVVGFAEKSGILALAITAHPDFDDTPLFDENGDGDPANDGADWHSHWVVLE